MWIDIACIVFVAVTVNHLGLVSAMEAVIRKRLPIVNCPKCLAFWTTMAYCCDFVTTHTFTVLAISFLASYSAIWLELLEGYIDTLYMKLYEKITAEHNDDTVAADADDGHTPGTMSDVREDRR